MFGTASGSVKSTMTRHVLLTQECPESGEIRTEKWKREYSVADIGTKTVSVEELQRHVKMLKRHDAKDVMSKRYVQTCDGLSKGYRNE